MGRVRRWGQHLDIFIVLGCAGHHGMRNISGGPSGVVCGWEPHPPEPADPVRVCPAVFHMRLLLPLLLPKVIHTPHDTQQVDTRWVHCCKGGTC
jgi:hypothetical protein